MQSGFYPVFAVLLGLAAASGAHAGSGKGMNVTAVAEHIFTQADADRDGAMTREEYAQGGLGKYGATFADFDLDEDGRVTRAEYHEVFARFHSGTRQDAI